MEVLTNETPLEVLSRAACMLEHTEDDEEENMEEDDDDDDDDFGEFM